MSREQAQAVEDALAGGPLCPWCGAQCQWGLFGGKDIAGCMDCARVFYRTKSRGVANYRAGAYWTANWSWAYECNRPKGSKPISVQRKPTDESSWMDGVNTNKPKRSNAQSAKKGKRKGKR